MRDLAENILAHISKKRYQPLKPKALARKLGLPQSEYKNFRALLKDMVREGRLEMTKSLAVRPAQPHGTVAGTFRKASAGFGFVRPSPGDPLAGQEIYIRASEVGDSSTGDEVLVVLTKRPSRTSKNPEGKIVRVLERATHQFVGTYYVEDAEGLVRVDGTVFSAPIYVGDPGAKGAEPDDKVVFEMIRFPSPSMRGEGVITEVLGPRGQPGVDTLSILRAYELPDKFADDVLSEARQQAAAFDESDLADREDYTDQIIITIDPADARDFDDAVSLAFDKRTHHWQLGVHIADVSHFAPPGSLLDREARNRGTSVYLPQLVLPMFPEIISNSLASLQQGRVRYVKSALMEFTHHGQRVHSRFANGAIRVTQRFSYEQVSALFDSVDASSDGQRESTSPKAPPPPLPRVRPEVLDLLLHMREFAMILRERRLRRGALELDMPETDLEFDTHGRVTGAHFHPRTVSHQVIEEFMLVANEAVAEHLADQESAFLRRVHAPPDPLKLKDFCEFARILGYDVNVKQALDRFQLQRILEESAKRPEVHAVHYALLRSMKRAQYGPQEEGHYALASNCYCHFTSPIRRYPDLTIHRLLDNLLRTGRAGSDIAELTALGEHCSFTERRADEAERDLIKIKLLDYLSTRIGSEMAAVITGVQDFGFFAEGQELPAEGLVHVSTLTDDYYYYDGMSHSLIGRRSKRRFRLGDKVKVKVARVDVERRQLDFRVAEADRRKEKQARGKG